MKSHLYQFQARDVARLLLPPLAVLGCLAAALHAGVAGKFLPRPRPILDLDRTVLIHQADASQRPQTARILLAGDSSCMMDVSAPLLPEALAPRFSALNLGTLSYLDLPAMGRLVAHFEQTNPRQLQFVILLMHPQALRQLEASPAHIRMLDDYYARRDSPAAGGPWRDLLGLTIFEGRFESRLLPRPLPGVFGAYYGFNLDFWNYLSEHGGSAIDPEPYSSSAPGNAEYRLPKKIQDASRRFAQQVPPGCRLLVAITPIPSSFALPGYPEQSRKMLLQWAEWLGTDAALTDLPSVLPEALFATTTHLNAAGAALYTERLAAALLPYLR